MDITTLSQEQKNRIDAFTRDYLHGSCVAFVYPRLLKNGLDIDARTMRLDEVVEMWCTACNPNGENIEAIDDDWIAGMWQHLQDKHPDLFL